MSEFKLPIIVATATKSPIRFNLNQQRNANDKLREHNQIRTHIAKLKKKEKITHETVLNFLNLIPPFFYILSL